MPDARLQRTRDAYRTDLQKALDDFIESGSLLREWESQVAANRLAPRALSLWKPPPAEPSDDDL